MGPGCQRVTCTHEKDVDVATVNGATAAWRRCAASARARRITAASSSPRRASTRSPLQTKVHLPRTVQADRGAVHDEEAAGRIPAVTVEIVAFIEAALHSADNHGAGEMVMTYPDAHGETCFLQFPESIGELSRLRQKRPAPPARPGRPRPDCSPAPPVRPPSEANAAVDPCFSPPVRDNRLRTCGNAADHWP